MNKTNETTSTSGPSEIHLTIRYTISIAFPLIGVVGTVANTLGAIIVVKSGLHKSSNVLLLSLIISDMCLVVWGFNFPNILTYWPRKTLPWNVWGWDYPYTSALLCHISLQVLLFAVTLGLVMNSSITVLITVERMIAVFLPLQFHRIVTPSRAWMAVGVVLLWWLPFPILRLSSIGFEYRYSQTYATWYGVWTYHKHLKAIEANYRKMLPYMEGFIPTIFVLTGCFCIGVKIAYTNKARKKLTSSTERTSSMEVTKTLVAVCSFYCLSKMYDYINQNTIKYFTGMHRLRILLSKDAFHLINSSVNFFIYVLINKQFLRIFKAMFKRKKKSHSARGFK